MGRCNTCFHVRVCRFVNEMATAETRVATGKSAAPFELTCNEYYHKANTNPYERAQMELVRSMGCIDPGETGR